MMPWQLATHAAFYSFFFFFAFINYAVGLNGTDLSGLEERHLRKNRTLD